MVSRSHQKIIKITVLTEISWKRAVQLWTMVQLVGDGHRSGSADALTKVPRRFQQILLHLRTCTYLFAPCKALLMGKVAAMILEGVIRTLFYRMLFSLIVHNENPTYPAGEGGGGFQVYLSVHTKATKMRNGPICGGRYLSGTERG